jgi:hypothetical protein
VISQLIMLHPLIALCAVIWVVCGVVAIALKGGEVLFLAGIVTVLIGIGHFISEGR